MQQHLSALQNGQPAPSPPPGLSDAEQAQLMLSTLTPEQQGALLAGYLSPEQQAQLLALLGDEFASSELGRLRAELAAAQQAMRDQNEHYGKVQAVADRSARAAGWLG